MSTYCRYCGVVSRNACSDYKQRYLEEELRTCGNLSDGSQRTGALYVAGFSQAAQEMEEIDNLRDENQRLRELLRDHGIPTEE